MVLLFLPGAGGVIGNEVGQNLLSWHGKQLCFSDFVGSQRTSGVPAYGGPSPPNLSDKGQTIRGRGRLRGIVSSSFGLKYGPQTLVGNVGPRVHGPATNLKPASASDAKLVLSFDNVLTCTEKPKRHDDGKRPPVQTLAARRGKSRAKIATSASKNEWEGRAPSQR